VRPPSEDPAQLDADIAAMRLLGKDLDEAKPDVPRDRKRSHWKLFPDFVQLLPSSQVNGRERNLPARVTDLPIHQGLAETFSTSWSTAVFDMAYSQDAVLGHAFAAVYEWVIEDRKIPVVPIFVKRLLTATSTPRRCSRTRKVIAKVIPLGPERVAITPAGECLIFRARGSTETRFAFDYWAIAQ